MAKSKNKQVKLDKRIINPNNRNIELNNKKIKPKKNENISDKGNNTNKKEEKLKYKKNKSNNKPVKKLEKFKKDKINLGKDKKTDLKERKNNFVKNKDIHGKKQLNSHGKKHFKDQKNGGKKELLESYDIMSDKSKVIVKINKTESGIIYEVEVHEISIATSVLLDEIRNELVSATTIGMNEIIDPEAFGKIKKRFTKEAEVLIKSKIPTIKDSVKDFLIGNLIQDMLGLGDIEYLINDPNLEEIVIPSSKDQIRIYHKRYGWIVANLKIFREDDIANYSNIIARRVGRQITVLSPLLDAHLVSGDRVNSILFPISTKGNTITIRKFARDPYTIIDFINNNTCNLEIACLIWLAIEFEMNILISGGTASGKTSFLNACTPFIPPNHRVISVEDTRELMLPDFLYWTPLVTRTANPEGKGEVSMLDLLVNSLRMRPDRIILGEMRREKEALVLFEAMHTGHSVYATLHADSASETIQRLINPPLNVPQNLLKAVNLNVVMFRDRRRGIRRVSQVAEFDSEQDIVTPNILYRWQPDTDKIISHSESSRFFEDLSRNTGLSQTEIDENLETKKRILEYLIKNNIRALDDFGRIMNMYYTNKDELMRGISRNDINKLLGR